MTERRRVFLNAVMSTVQVAVTGASFLLLYRYLLESIGAELAGVWALVLSWTAAASVGGLGLTGGALKFVSKHRARDDEDRVEQVVETSVVSVAAVFLVLLTVAYPLFAELLHVVVEPSTRVGDAIAVLPYALVSFWFTSVSGVVQSCIDGTQRVFIRNILVMISALLYLGLAVLLVPEGGLIGLAQAQVLQSAVVLLGGWIALRVLIPGVSMIPHRWRKDVFKEMFSYSVNFQLVSVAQLMFQPVSKSLISKFGGVGPVFYFEMAHKLVFQIRALIVMAHQSLVPTIAHWHETSRERVQAIYKESFRVLLFLITAGLPLLVGLTPIISRVWIGSYEETFVVYAVLLFVGWFLNILINPAYFGYVGIGRMRWNVASHLTIGVLNVGLGLLLGLRFGGLGVVIAYTAAVLAGSVVPIWAYHHEYGIHWSELVGRHSAFLAAASLCGLILIYWMHETLRSVANPWLILIVLPIAYAVVIVVPVWRHPLRKRVRQSLPGLLVGGRDSSPTSIRS